MLPPQHPQPKTGHSAVQRGTNGFRKEVARPIFGPPVWMERGMFGGRNTRFSLEVAQEPIHGRRRTEKDRRPLAHCPIVRIRMMDCRMRPTGEWDEEEVDINEIEPTHLVCAADLCCPSTPNLSALTTSQPSSRSSQASRSSSSSPERSSISDPCEAIPLKEEEKDHVMADKPGLPSLQLAGNPSASRTNGHHFDSGIAGPFMQSVRSQSPFSPVKNDASWSRYQSGSGDRPRGSSHEGEIHEIGSLYSNKKVKPAAGRNLYGNLHVAGVRVPAIDAAMGVWFLFTDLTVRHEGTHALRFRCFDLTAVDPSSDNPAPPLVECRSQAFKVYSPRSFPGLPKPTELAEHFARQGFKLNTRKNERQVAVSPPPLVEPPPPRIESQPI